MIPIHVALVPRYEDDNVNTPTVLRVAAALQVQLTRDFTPIWGIPAVVSAFQSLADVPPASIPLVIVEPGSLDPRFHGFHVTEGDQPFGLVEGRQGWSLPASHELLEIVCDPEGKRKVLGESIAGLADRAELAPDADQYPPQGQVAYLLEVCDPCQAPEFAYTVNGIQVSDFVTPRYYAPRETKCGCYSFTGAVTQPLQILRGGYISWYTSIPGTPVWQATRSENGAFRVGPLAVPAPPFSRHRINRFTDRVSDLRPATLQSGEAVKKEKLAQEAAKRYGEELRGDLHDLLAAYEADRKRKPVPLAKLLPILNRLATDKPHYESFKNDPNSLFAEEALKDLLPPGSHYPGGRYPSQEEFKTAYDWVKNHIDQSADPVSGIIATTMIKGDTLGGP